MASGAVLWCRFVEKNCLCGDHLRQLVTLGAAHILVCATEGEGGAFVVVEERRLPFRAVVALGAASDVGTCELLAVYVLMAIFTLCRRGLEIHIH